MSYLYGIISTVFFCLLINLIIGWLKLVSKDVGFKKLLSLGSSGGGEIGETVGDKGLNDSGANCVSSLPTAPKRL